MKRRAFLPPAVCSNCAERPVLGDTLFHTGAVWICAACLTAELPGNDTMTKMASRSLQADQSNALSKRARAAGEIEEASTLDSQASWHQQAAISVHEHGNRLARQAIITHGEVATPASYMKDTLADPDIAAVESSEIRGRLLHQNDVVALGVDIAKTVQASNTAEKLICHEIAVAHRVAMQQASWALAERDPNIEIKRLQISARMMASAQDGLLTLHKLRATGPQTVTVQHVHVEAGGQAVVGNVQRSPAQ